MTVQTYFQDFLEFRIRPEFQAQISTNYDKKQGPEITLGDLNSRLRLTRRLELDITFTRSNSPNVLRTDPGDPGTGGTRESPGGTWEPLETVRNGTKR